jgi:hypothetical protein
MSSKNRRSRSGPISAQRALDVGITEITKKTDLKIAIESLERSKYRRVASVTFSIKEKAVPKGD